MELFQAFAHPCWFRCSVIIMTFQHLTDLVQSCALIICAVLIVRIQRTLRLHVLVDHWAEDHKREAQRKRGSQ